MLLSSFLHIFGRNTHHVEPSCTLDTLLQTFKSESTHLALVKQVRVNEQVHKRKKADGVTL